jgi:hypothetical protein
MDALPKIFYASLSRFGPPKFLAPEPAPFGAKSFVVK